ncbi:MAG: cob(I)yrinic acid a,c-diamide adenosyltransferase [Patescibacteria group bacterium]
MNSISTKTGDKGQSGLISGERMSKDASFFDAIGTVDELNSWLGFVVSKFDNNFPKNKKFLLKVQNTLFYIGAELAKSPKVKLTSRHLKILELRASDLEFELKAKWHDKFLLPGGTELAGVLDIARSVCRRTERVLVAHSKNQKIRPLILKYLNRLSDYLYLLRTYINAKYEYGEREFEA